MCKFYSIPYLTFILLYFNRPRRPLL